MNSSGSPELPPGFRFHPTDEELIVHYLRNQALSRPCPVPIISELNIYKFDPWELPGKAEFGEEEWYFFSPRDRKYPNGARPNRATASGYWKATGTDKAIYSKSKYVGVKKALVFYKGRPPKGVKSDWIMHEYRLGGTGTSRPKGSIRLDDWVLCRIYQKKQQRRSAEEEWSEHVSMSPSCEADKGVVDDCEQQHQEQQQQPSRFPRTPSLASLLEGGYMLNDYPSGWTDEFHAFPRGISSSVAHPDVISQFLNNEACESNTDMAAASGGSGGEVFGLELHGMDRFPFHC